MVKRKSEGRRSAASVGYPPAMTADEAERAGACGKNVSAHTFASAYTSASAHGHPLRKLAEMLSAGVLLTAMLCGRWGCAQPKVSVSGLSKAAKLTLSFERDGERFVVEAELGEGEDAAGRVFCFRFREPKGIEGMTVTRAAEGGAVTLAMGGPSAEVPVDSPLLLPLRALCPGGAELTGNSRDGDTILLSMRRGDDLYTLCFKAGAERPHRIEYRDATGDITLSLEETA